MTPPARRAKYAACCRPPGPIPRWRLPPAVTRKPASTCICSAKICRLRRPQKKSPPRAGFFVSGAQASLLLRAGRCVAHASGHEEQRLDGARGRGECLLENRDGSLTLVRKCSQGACEQTPRVFRVAVEG